MVATPFVIVDSPDEGLASRTKGTVPFWRDATNTGAAATAAALALGAATSTADTLNAPLSSSAFASTTPDSLRRCIKKPVCSRFDSAAAALLACSARPRRTAAPPLPCRSADGMPTDSVCTYMPSPCGGAWFCAIATGTSTALATAVCAADALSIVSCSWSATAFSTAACSAASSSR